MVATALPATRREERTAALQEGAALSVAAVDHVTQVALETCRCSHLQEHLPQVASSSTLKRKANLTSFGRRLAERVNIQNYPQGNRYHLIHASFSAQIALVRSRSRKFRTLPRKTCWMMTSIC